MKGHVWLLGLWLWSYPILADQVSFAGSEDLREFDKLLEQNRRDPSQAPQRQLRSPAPNAPQNLNRGRLPPPATGALPPSGIGAPPSGPGGPKPPPTAAPFPGTMDRPSPKRPPDGLDGRGPGPARPESLPRRAPTRPPGVPPQPPVSAPKQPGPPPLPPGPPPPSGPAVPPKAPSPVAPPR